MMKKMIFWAALFSLGCKGKPAATTAQKHLALLHQPGVALWVDRLDNRAILQKADTTGETTFSSFLVGSDDSLSATDATKRQEREKYIQYAMQQDWTGLMDGDSLRPVFFQEKAGLNPQRRENAMVFEIPRGRRIDTLIYQDHFGAWGTQIFVLNGK